MIKNLARVMRMCLCAKRRTEYRENDRKGRRYASLIKHISVVYSTFKTVICSTMSMVGSHNKPPNLEILYGNRVIKSPSSLFPLLAWFLIKVLLIQITGTFKQTVFENVQTLIICCNIFKRMLTFLHPSRFIIIACSV